MDKKNNNLFNKLFLTSWRPFVWIALIILLIYSSSLSFQLTNLDDNLLTIENIDFLKDFTNIIKAYKIDAFNSQTIGQNLYRPLLTVSFIIDTQFGQNTFFFYHLSNIIIHLLATFLLLIFLQKLRYSKKISFLFSIIFALHPLLTNAVVWLPARNDSLLTLFVLASFILLINFINNQKILSYLGHLLLFLFALFTKETAILLPVIYFIYIILIKKDKLFSLKYLWLGLGWLFSTIFWFFLRQAAVQAPDITLWEMLKLIIMKSPAILFYLGNIIFPFNLSTYPTLLDAPLIWGVITILLVLILIKYSKNKRVNYLIFGLLWFFLFLVPTLAIKVSPFFENRVYLPMIGFLIILLEIDFIKNIKFKNKISLIVICLVIIFLSTISLTYAQNYYNSENFWQKAVTSSPHSAVAHSQLGNVYMINNDLEKAKNEYLGSLELNTNEPMFLPLIAGIHNNLGIIYAQKGQFDLAEREYQKSLATNSYYVDAYFNLGLLYLKENNMDEAARLWEKTVELNPNYLKAHNNLAIYYYQQNDLEKAIYHINQIQQRGGQLSTPLREILEEYMNNN